ncbi:MAG: hypothetical protein ACC645_12510 [Pirellulales bacterium]
MKEEHFESLLRAADRSAAPPPEPRPDLAGCVRHEARVRRSGVSRRKLASALAGGYVAGLATVWGLSALAPSRPVNVAVDGMATSNSDNAPVDVAPPSGREPEQQKAHDIARSKPADVMLAKSPYQLLRELGAVSRQNNDFQGAIGLYSEALEAATDEESEVAYAQDDWLMTFLKRDRTLSKNASTQGDSI